jgi:hypothetical protein
MFVRGIIVFVTNKKGRREYVNQTTLTYLHFKSRDIQVHK